MEKAAVSCVIRVVEDCCMEKAAVSCVIRVVEDCCMEKAAVSCVILSGRRLLYEEGSCILCD